MSNIWSKEETLWSFALYGTAVGAGTLFLPIQLGSAGAVVLFITALVAWPLTYWPHKALCQFILSSKTSAGEGITGAVTHYYGKKIGNLITTLYFIAFFVVVLIYAVAITNSLTEQLAKHMVIDLRIRMLVSLGVVLILNLIFLMGRHATIRVMGFLVFPLIAYFLFLSIYLVGSSKRFRDKEATNRANRRDETQRRRRVGCRFTHRTFVRTPFCFHAIHCQFTEDH